MNPNEVWQVSVNGEIYETTFQGLVDWIAEGSLLQADMVRRGNLRWLEAGKIPALYGFFNAKELGVAMPQVQVSTTDAATADAPETVNVADAQGFQPVETNQFNNGETFPPHEPSNGFHAPPNNFNEPANNFHAPANQFNAPNTNVCVIHNDAAPDFICETCANVFCAQCPKRYGSSVIICPMCGAMCKKLEQFQEQQYQQFQYHHDLGAGFGFGDFGNALAYPFKFKSSLFLGAILFMFFTIGQSAASMGSFFLVAASIFCVMMSNALTFGVLANTVENFSQGKIGKNFMPEFDDFSLWDDVVHPFFLSVAVYIVSFGLLIAIVLGTVWYVWNTITSTLKPANPSAIQQTMPGYDSSLDSVNQMQDFEDFKDKMNERTRLRNDEMFNEEALANSNMSYGERENAEFERLNNMIIESRKQQLESTIGKTPETQQAEMKSMITSLITTAGIVIIPMILAFLWGLFYFPAACAVAGYTRSFTATLNPFVGLDTIKRLGFDYVKILLMGLILLIFSFVAGIIFGLIFSPFAMPQVGNLPATAIGSLFTFYISVVFSCVLGYAMYKCSDRLNLYRG